MMDYYCCEEWWFWSGNEDCYLWAAMQFIIINMFWFKKKIEQVIPKDQFNFKKAYTFSERESKRKLID